MNDYVNIAIAVVVVMGGAMAVAYQIAGLPVMIAVGFLFVMTVLADIWLIVTRMHFELQHKH